VAPTRPPPCKKTSLKKYQALAEVGATMNSDSLQRVALIWNGRRPIENRRPDVSPVLREDGESEPLQQGSMGKNGKPG